MKKVSILMFIAFAFVSIFFGSESIKASNGVNTYDGDMGYSYTNSMTEFRVWSSSASEIEVVVEGTVNKTAPLIKDSSTNLWYGSIEGDLIGCEYTYTIKYADSTTYEGVLDPYGKYLNASKSKNTIYDNSISLFEEWENIKSPLSIKDKNKIIYGIDIKNFSNSPSWLGDETNRGKLLALNESGVVYNGTAIGFDHVKNLGVTYIEVDEIFSEYNPFIIDSEYVIGVENFSGELEFKQVVSSYYNSYIGVIVSFDFNSLSESLASSLNKIDKEYYESATEIDLNKKMIQKYIRDIILYWVEEYKLSGIKIENMSNFDVSFINEISEELMKINEEILIYGDGSYTSLNNLKAGENNLKELNGVGMVNGSLSYALLGDLFSKDEVGILMGNYSDEIKETFKFAMLSSVDNGQINYEKVKGISYKNDWNNETSYKLINYLSERDGLSLYDKLKVYDLFEKNESRKQKIILAYGTLLMAGGIPYIEAGTEFMASYQTSDSDGSVCVSNNAICFYASSDKKSLDWSRAFSNGSIVETFKSLANFRKNESLYVQAQRNQIKNNVEICFWENGSMGYVRKYPNAYVRETDKVIAIFNYSNNEYTIGDFDEEKGWKKSYYYNNASRDGSDIVMTPYSIYMAYREKPPKINQGIMLILVIGVIGILYTFNVVLNKKLVEKRGYDIKEISKKYRPFINKEKVKKQENENIEQPQDGAENVEYVEEDYEEQNEKDNTDE